jgi:membrane protein
MNLRPAWTLARSTIAAWHDDRAPSMGAAIAYYTVFSLAPLLLIVISVAGIFFGAEAARGEIVAQLAGLMGTDAAHSIEGFLASVAKPETGVLATIVGAVVMLVGATTVFGEIQDSLDRIWRVPEREDQGLLSLVRSRLLSFGMILGVGFLLVVSLALSAALAALGRWWAAWFGPWVLVLQAVNFIVSLGLLTVIFAMIYKILPRVPVRWRDVWIGAAATALLLTVGKLAIGLYIGRSSVASGFGAAGSLVVILVWVYYSAQIFLLGAEFTWLYAHDLGSLKDRPLDARGNEVGRFPQRMAPPAAGSLRGNAYVGKQ